MPTCTFILQNKHCREDVCIKHIHLLKFSQKEFSVRWHLRQEKAASRKCSWTMTGIIAPRWVICQVLSDKQEKHVTLTSITAFSLSLSLSPSLSHTHTHTHSPDAPIRGESRTSTRVHLTLVSMSAPLCSSHLCHALCMCCCCCSPVTLRELQGTSGNKPQSTTPVWGHAWSRGWRRLCRFLLETVEKRRRRRSSTSGRQQGTICCHGDRCVEKSSLISDRSRLDTGHVSPQDEYCRGY